MRFFFSAINNSTNCANRLKKRERTEPCCFCVFSKNCYYDHLEIRDGHWHRSPLIGRYCGRGTPNEIVSNSDRLWIRFQTISNFHGAGFQLEVSFDAHVTGPFRASDFQAVAQEINGGAPKS